MLLPLTAPASLFSDEPASQGSSSQVPTVWRRVLYNSDGTNIFGDKGPDIPIYGSIEVGMASGVYTTPETYRRDARRLWDEGVDSIYLFNFFCFRAAGKPIPFLLLNELSDPATIKD